MKLISVETIALSWGYCKFILGEMEPRVNSLLEKLGCQKKKKKKKSCFVNLLNSTLFPETWISDFVNNSILTKNQMNRTHRSLSHITGTSLPVNC